MRSARIAAVVVTTLVLVWAGVLVGVSLIATPVKFQAHGLTMPVALEVGRHTFAASHVVQLVLAVLAVILVRAAHVGRFTRGAIDTSTVLLVVQLAVLMPILDDRVRVVIAGGQPTGWSPHAFYVVLELAKLALLVAGAVRAMWQSPAARTHADVAG